MERLSAAYGHLLKGLIIVAAVLVLAMVAMVTADVLMRNLADTGLIWANEVTEYSLYLVTLLSAPWLLRSGRHVRIDLLIDAVPMRIARLMEAGADLLGLVVCLVFVWYGTAVTYESARLGSITIKNLVFPEWWLLAPLPVAFLLLAIEFVFRLHRLATGTPVYPAPSGASL
jgi:TRAP-type C4-dicarboxylate transport system permease small subunit